MANVAVQKIEGEKPVLAPVLKELKDTFEDIRRKAFELFEHRGGVPGKEMDDWIQAERDLFWVPQAELTESDAEFKIQVAVPGFEAKNIQVTAQPGEILVRGNVENRFDKKEKNVCYSEFGEKSLYRRFELEAPINLDRTNANVENGMLTITVPKKTVEKTSEKAKAAA